MLMESLRNMIFMLAFMWMGIIFTMDTLEGTPKGDWTSAAIRLGLVLTVAVVLVELVFQAFRLHRARSK